MVWQVPDTVDTAICAPDDGCRYHTKHVEHFPEINKLCNVASCWIYITIYLWCTDPWTFNSPLFMQIEGTLSCSQIVPILRRMNPVDAATLSLISLISIFNPISPSVPGFSKWSLSSSFRRKSSVCVILLSHMCHVYRPSQPPPI